MITTERKDPIIFDTTLREGFQTPGGIGGSLEERVYVAALIQNYAHWVELGMPANNVEYNFISAIRDRFLQEKYPVGIAVLARCQDLDVERSAEVMSNYTNNLIHLFIGTSEQHRNVRFGGKDEEFYVELISKFVEKASANPIFSRVMFSPEDSYRAWDQNPEAFMRFISAAKNGYERGNKRVGRKDSVIFNLPDTTGASTVERFCQLVERVNTEFGDEENAKDEALLASISDGMIAINKDGKVDIFDYNLLFFDFGKTGKPWFTTSDINRDGKVDTADYDILIVNFGK